MGLVAAAVKRIAAVRPRAGLALAGGIGYWGGARLAGTRRPAPQDLATAFGELEARRLRRLQRELASCEYRNRALRFVVRKRGLDPLLPLLQVEAGPLERLLEEGTPVVVTGWHLGPRFHLTATLRQLGRRALVAVSEPDLAGEGSEQLEVRLLREEDLLAGFLRRAIDVLAAGGIVGMALDGNHAAVHTAPFLGHCVEVGRGAASLARMCGARLVPITARWLGRSAAWATRLHPPLPEPQVEREQAARFESELLGAAVRWFETFVRRNPEVVQLRRLTRTRDAEAAGRLASAS